MHYFLFTDIEDSTKLWEKHAVEMAAALKRHDDIIYRTVERFGGRVVKHLGDGVFAVFERGRPLGCAIRIQKELAKGDWRALGDLRVRIALNAGTSEMREGDFFGPDVNRTHRLLEAGWGGQVLTTRAVVDNAEPQPGAAFKSLGVHLLKDLSEPQQVFQVLHPELPIQEFPPLRSLSTKPHNLPPQATPFLGREEELARIEALLEDKDCRLLTLAGPGGVGKTRLALQAGAERIDDFEYGVYFVPLAPLASPEFIVTAVADALRFSFYGRDEPQREIFDYLGTKAILLIMDNFEHVVEGAPLVSEVLKAAPAVKVLATSREPLGLSGEQIFRVSGMTYPAEGEDAGQSDTFSAVRLFVERARAVDQTFVPSAADVEAVSRVCRRLEGLPLGIEMAASWIKALSVAEIAAEMEKNLDFLQTPSRDAPERHRNLRAVFDSSWRLLSADERGVLKRLSVFRGSFTREASAQVAGTSPQLLASLVDKSLLRRSYTGRYQIPEAIKEYADEKLTEDAALSKASRDLHCGYYAELLYRCAGPLVRGEPRPALAEIGAEIENARAAWRWAADNGYAAWAVKAVEALFHFYDIRGMFAEGEDAFAYAAAKLAQGGAENALFTTNTVVKAKVLTRRGWFCARRYRLEEAEKLYERSLEIVRKLGLRAEEGFALDCLGILRHNQGKYEAAEGLFRQALEAFEDSRAQFGQALALEHLGSVAYRLGHYDKAMDLFGDSLEAYESVGSQRGTASALSNLADVARARGTVAEAEELASRSLTLQRELGFPLGTAASLLTLGEVAETRGNYTEARKMYRESLSTYREIGSRWGVAHALEKLGRVAGDLGDYAAAEKLYRESLELRREINDRRGIASSMQYLGGVQFIRGDYVKAKRYLEEALAIQRSIGEQSGVAASLASLAGVANKVGGFPEARRLFEDALSAFRGLGDRRGEASALNGLANVRYAEGKYNDARRLYKESLKVSRAIGYLRGVSFATNNLGDIAEELGELDEARRLYYESLAIDREMGYPRGVAVSLNNLAHVAYAKNDFVEAERMTCEGLELCEKIGYKEGTVFCLTTLGRVELARLNTEKAREHFSEGLRLALESNGVPWALEIVVFWAELKRSEGDHARAVELLTFALDHPASETVNRRRAEELRARIAGEIPREAYDEALRRSKTLTFREVATA